MPYCIYLRKSRSDLELEKHNEEETLQRHEKILLELAKNKHLSITAIHKEVVSGETIASRPVMQQLLHEVEEGMWEGVLVAEVERLARGDTIDQGIVAQTFKYSNTLIITPVKTYDPNNEFDEEYFEFGLFMSRREYKTIRRRMLQGRKAAAKEGRFVGSIPPFGYEKVKIKNGKGFTLVPVPEEVEIVQYIFDVYVNGEVLPDGTVKRYGLESLSNKLIDMRIKNRDKVWNRSSLAYMMRNPVYIGKIRSNYTVKSNKMSDGKVVSKRNRNSKTDVVISQGMHVPIIDEELFYEAGRIISSHAIPALAGKDEITNPFAGLIVCGFCGHRMQVNSAQSGKKRLKCINYECECVSSMYDLVEDRIIQALKQWIGEYELSYDLDKGKHNKTLEMKKASVKLLRKESEKLSVQLDKTHDLLEQGIYSTEKFLERSKMLSDKIEETENDIAALLDSIEEEKMIMKNRREIVPNIKHVIDVFDELESAAEKNALLKEILEKVEYKKSAVKNVKRNYDKFEITIFPRLPKFKDG